MTTLAGHAPDTRVDHDVVVPTLALVALAAAYHAMTTRASEAAERAAMDLWFRIRPVTDSDMDGWIRAWDRILAAHQRTQRGLTESYLRQQLRLFGMQVPPTTTLPASSRLADDLQRWANGPYAPQDMRDKANDALSRMRAGEGTAADEDFADRALNLHSPVIKHREALGASPAEQAARQIAANVTSQTFNAGRAAERRAMDRAFPRFKNGQQMRYVRVPQAGACGWCQIVSTRVYSFDSFQAGAQWHANCRCTWRALSPDEANLYTKTYGETKDYYAAATALTNQTPAPYRAGWAGPDPGDYTAYIKNNRAVTEAATGAQGEEE